MNRLDITPPQLQGTASRRALKVVLLGISALTSNCGAAPTSVSETPTQISFFCYHVIVIHQLIL